MKNIINIIESKWFKKSKGIFLILALGFLGVIIKKNLTELIKYDITLNIHYLLIGVGLWALAFMGGILIWYKIIYDLGVKINPLKFLAIGSISMITKFIPVTFMGIAARSTLLIEHGVTIKQISTSLLYESFFNVLTAFLFWGSIINPKIWLMPTIICAFLCFLLYRKSFRNFKIKVNTGIAFLGNFFLQFIEGCAVFFFIKSIIPISIDNILKVAAYFQGAWAIGFCFILVPVGIGVREGTFMLLLSNILPYTQSIIASIMARLGCTITVNMAAGIIIILFYLKKRYAKNKL